ncbi:hypothetical protein, partial [Prevotella sp.]|uniref:hypothetical protein n=1 Tax=Prevotella sp. TaxID=59823 RepID=UPI003F7F75E0
SFDNSPYVCGLVLLSAQYIRTGSILQAHIGFLWVVSCSIFKYVGIIGNVIYCHKNTKFIRRNIHLLVLCFCILVFKESGGVRLFPVLEKVFVVWLWKG